jgi:hypothetical protein
LVDVDVDVDLDGNGNSDLDGVDDGRGSSVNVCAAKYSCRRVDACRHITSPRVRWF